MNTVLIDENIPFLADIISQKYTAKSFAGRELTKQRLIDEACTALFVRSTTRINADLLDNTNVKFVASATSGIDHVDLNYLESKGIQFSYALGSNSNSVAEYAMYAMIFDSINRPKSMSSQTLGIIGFGNIGKKVAHYANKAGMKILINDAPLKADNYEFPEACEYCELDELMSRADIITNHVPLVINGQFPTYRLLNSSNLNKIKDNALIIHTSRGGVINENDLTKLLKSREDIELVIDVFENEPDVNEYLIQRAIIATPHVAGYSRNGKINGINMILEAFEKFANIQFDKQIIADAIPQNKERCLVCDFIENFHKITDTRKILDDSLRLNDLLHLSGTDRREEFDRQRREYPTRFEYLAIEEGKLGYK